MLYKGRKKYTQKEAEGLIESTLQMKYTYAECLLYWTMSSETRTDRLIGALCNQSREEMIQDAKNKIEYIDSKLTYLYQFSPNYIPRIG